MQRNLATLSGLALGLAALTGCVQAPAPAPALCPAFTAPLPAPPPIAPPPAAVIVPPTPVWTPPRHHVAVVHSVHHVVVVHRHWVHRYVARAAWSPYCGSVTHPCDVKHLVVPEQ